MQYVAIKKELKDGKTVYIVNAIPLKNKSNSTVQKIPHPLGTDMIEYSSLEQAQEAVTRAGFACILPDGKKEFQVPKNKNKKVIDSNNYEAEIMEMLQTKINSSNPNICQAAVMAIAQFPGEQTFDILFEKLGEDNDLIRKNAIEAICEYGNILQDRIVKALEHENWVTRNSALICIKQLAQSEAVYCEKFISPLINTCNDSNPIVQSCALQTLALVYKTYKKQISKNPCA